MIYPPTNQKLPIHELRNVGLIVCASDFGFRPSFGFRFSGFGFPPPLPSVIREICAICGQVFVHLWLNCSL